MSTHPGGVDTSGLERLAHGWESGATTTREFCKLFPAELAKVRRQVYRQAGLLPVPVNGSSQRGLKGGYFMKPLRDGTRGYLQRRTDDCLAAAIASLLQVPIHQVPDLGIEAKLAGGMDPEELERGIWGASGAMRRWLDQRGVTIMYHPTPPTSAKRWIGVVVEDDMYSDHCLIMSGGDCLFDPANLLPLKGQPVTAYEVSDIDYGITIERR